MRYGVLLGLLLSVSSVYAEEKKMDAAPVATAPTVADTYECSMCHVTSDKPGKCPKCGMDMVKAAARTEMHKTPCDCSINCQCTENCSCSSCQKHHEGKCDCPSGDKKSSCGNCSGKHKHRSHKQRAPAK